MIGRAHSNKFSRKIFFWEYFEVPLTLFELTDSAFNSDNTHESQLGVFYPKMYLTWHYHTFTSLSFVLL